MRDKCVCRLSHATRGLFNSNMAKATYGQKEDKNINKTCSNLIKMLQHILLQRAVFNRFFSPLIPVKKNMLQNRGCLSTGLKTNVSPNK